MKNRQAGFTLVEILLAFLFLSIAIVPIGYLLDSYYSKTNSTRLTGIATYLAEGVMEDLSALAYDDPSFEPVTYTYAPAALSDFSYLTKIHQISKDSNFGHTGPGHSDSGDGTTGFKRIKVIIYWDEGLEGDRVELVKVRGNY